MEWKTFPTVSGHYCENGNWYVRTYKIFGLSGYHQQGWQDGFPFTAEGENNKPWTMKTWVAWVLLIIGVSIIILLGYWLTTVLSIWTSIYLTTFLNFIVSVYLAYQEYKWLRYYENPDPKYQNKEKGQKYQFNLMKPPFDTLTELSK